MKKPIIKIKQLSLHYPQYTSLLRRPKEGVRAVNDINLTIFRGESLGLVGESGCGKSTLGKTLIRFYKPTSGNILYYPEQQKPIDITHMTPNQLKKATVRQKFQMLLQDHSTAMNPRMTIKNIILEGICSQFSKPKMKMKDEILSCLMQVGLNETHLNRFPHEFSGGQRQRICIARVLSVKPDFIVLDEPSSALDVSVQAQILLLLNEIREKTKITYLFITHNLLILKYVCTRVVVMYLGKIVEIIDVNRLFNESQHPYTLTLINSVPDLDSQNIITPPKGEVAYPSGNPTGCVFYRRCRSATQKCHQSNPSLQEISANHWVSCHQLFKKTTI